MYTKTNDDVFPATRLSRFWGEGSSFVLDNSAHSAVPAGTEWTSSFLYERRGVRLNDYYTVLRLERWNCNETTQLGRLKP